MNHFQRLFAVTRPLTASIASLSSSSSSSSLSEFRQEESGTADDASEVSTSMQRQGQRQRPRPRPFLGKSRITPAVVTVSKVEETKSNSHVDDSPSAPLARPWSRPLVLASAAAKPRQKKKKTKSEAPPSTPLSRASILLRPFSPSGCGYYYGLSETVKQRGLSRQGQDPADGPSGTTTKLNQKTSLQEALDQLRHLQEKCRELEQHVESLALGLGGVAESSSSSSSSWDQVARDVEDWAFRLFFEEDKGEHHGWKEVTCNKLVRNKFNKKGQTKVLLKWMRDPRGPGHDNDITDEKTRLYPCVKCLAEIDAPVEDVWAYLADESRVSEYNDLVERHSDLEVLSPHSKICWGQCPQVLFIKPRDFVSFCSHRWTADGKMQIVVNQACQHKDAPIPDSKEGGDGKACRAYSLRGANFITGHPQNPNKTRFMLLAHGSVGGDIPDWAVRTAVNALAPLEPFKLFHKIEQGVKRRKAQEAGKVRRGGGPVAEDDDDDLTPRPSRRSKKPAGLSQMGYACFWPNGGGLKEELQWNQSTRNYDSNLLFPETANPMHQENEDDNDDDDDEQEKEKEESEEDAGKDDKDDDDDDDEEP